MRWKIGGAFGVFFATAALAAHWWGAGESGFLAITLVVGVGVFAVLMYAASQSDGPP